MSTFNGYIAEFPGISIDYFAPLSGSPAPVAYFLSHIHTDHTKGLDNYCAPSFIYCSAATKAILLRMEKYPNRLNFDRGILETKTLHFKHLKSVLRPIPLNTPTEISLSLDRQVRVTLLDANHCPGAVMFLIEGTHTNILYTGDIRAEKWWVDSLVRSPVMIPYASGMKIIDTLYLDTTHANADESCRSFPSKAFGLRYLIKKIAEYPQDTVFHLNSWTMGYEEAWTAIALCFSSEIHVDRYKASVYAGLSDVIDAMPHTGSSLLNGFQIGGLSKPGYLTLNDARFHTCDPQCEVARRLGTVRIIPVINESTQELGAPVPRVGIDPITREDILNPETITFPFARHSSHEELCELVGALRPKSIFPCVVDEDDCETDMESLFGHLRADKNSTIVKERDCILNTKEETTFLPKMNVQSTNEEAMESDFETTQRLSSPFEESQTIPSSPTSPRPASQGAQPAWRTDLTIPGVVGRVEQQQRQDVSSIIPTSKKKPGSDSNPKRPEPESAVFRLNAVSQRISEARKLSSDPRNSSWSGSHLSATSTMTTSDVAPDRRGRGGRRSQQQHASTRYRRRREAWLAATDGVGAEWAALSTLSSAGKYEKEVELHYSK